MARTLSVGESLVGEGNEVAHIDMMVGPKSGPVGQAFAEALLNQKEGHTNLLAVVAPNLPAKPDTIIANKVTIKGAKQAVQMFGPAQAAVAREEGPPPARHRSASEHVRRDRGGGRRGRRPAQPRRHHARRRPEPGAV